MLFLLGYTDILGYFLPLIPEDFSNLELFEQCWAVSWIPLKNVEIFD
jgi:hypothetical protein